MSSDLRDKHSRLGPDPELMALMAADPDVADFIFGLMCQSEERRLQAYRATLPREIPHPGTDPRLVPVALALLESAYVDGDFGEQERPAEWIARKAAELADCLQGAFDDFCFVEAAK